jgi:hypothetical protein
MMSKSAFISIVTFAFGVMPTCSFLTVYRDNELVNSGVYRPTKCQDIYPTITNEPQYSDEIFFESLCWNVWAVIVFEMCWGACLGLLLTTISVTTAMAQYSHPITPPTSDNNSTDIKVE